VVSDARNSRLEGCASGAARDRSRDGEATGWLGESQRRCSDPPAQGDRTEHGIDLRCADAFAFAAHYRTRTGRTFVQHASEPEGSVVGGAEDGRRYGRSLGRSAGSRGEAPHGALELADQAREEHPITFLTFRWEGERASECLASIVERHGVRLEATSTPWRLRGPRTRPQRMCQGPEPSRAAEALNRRGHVNARSNLREARTATVIAEVRAAGCSGTAGIFPRALMDSAASLLGDAGRARPPVHRPGICPDTPRGVGWRWKDG
jgi:hypothetical protein